MAVITNNKNGVFKNVVLNNKNPQHLHEYISVFRFDYHQIASVFIKKKLKIFIRFCYDPNLNKEGLPRNVCQNFNLAVWADVQ